MILKSRNFPHPVLNPVTDDFKTSHFNALITETKETASDFKFLVEFKLKNETLEKLTENNKATYNVHFECSSTMKRLLFSFSKDDLNTVSKDKSEVVLKGEVEVPKHFLNKKVDVNFLIIANDVIEAYKNEDAHEDFMGMSFPIEKGDNLAYGVTQTIHIEKEPISSTNSIFKISKDASKNAKPMIVISNDNQIEIMLSKVSYEKVANLKDYGSDCNKVLVSMLYLPALVDVLFNIHIAKDDEYQMGDYENYDWFRTLEKKAETSGSDIRDLDAEEITPLAYQLLNNEEDDTWNALENLIFREDSDE